MSPKFQGLFNDGILSSLYYSQAHVFYVVYYSDSPNEKPSPISFSYAPHSPMHWQRINEEHWSRDQRKIMGFSALPLYMECLQSWKSPLLLDQITCHVACSLSASYCFIWLSFLKSFPQTVGQADAAGHCLWASKWETEAGCVISESMQLQNGVVLCKAYIRVGLEWLCLSKTHKGMYQWQGAGVNFRTTFQAANSTRTIALGLVSGLIQKPLASSATLPGRLLYYIHRSGLISSSLYLLLTYKIETYRAKQIKIKQQPGTHVADSTHKVKTGPN